MISFLQILRGLFRSEGTKPSVTSIEITPDPLYENSVYQGVEFLDDHLRFEDNEQGNIVV